jgi:NADH-quinone oxidoreductase subunit L
VSLDLVWLIPALPLAGFVLILLFGRRLGEPGAGYLATAMVAASFVVVGLTYLEVLGRPEADRTYQYSLFEWMPVGGLDIDVGFLVDPLSLTMALFVTGIGSLIHLYAVGYMHGDPKFSKFFLYLNLFVFSMLMLVMGSNMLVTFLGWEGVGVCSYFLISFWHTRPSAATAGKKAFVTNRIGDWGFMVAMFFTWQAIGSLDYVVLRSAAEGGAISETLATGIALMLLVGAAGKSAQLPLFVWLPDAMEGPTPVSALIHAATMVTAGVYLMCRAAPVLDLSDTAMWVVAIVGAATALFAATAAIAQNDIKKVLAYSTVSQLGFMFLAVGSGGYVAAVFHMVTHAFFKALMFLGSGSVIHGMHEEQDMRYMGALRKVMPITAFTFIIGWLAIAGVPPFAGFWSKDEILLYAWKMSPVLWAVGLVTALITAFYMTRQVIMVFYGEARWNDPRPEPAHGDAAHGDAAHGHATHGDATHGDATHGGIHPHESPWQMTAPLVVLAVLSVIGGALNLPFTKSLHFLGHWLHPVVGAFENEEKVTTAIKVGLALAATAAALSGIVIAYLVYSAKKVKAVEPAILGKAWGVDAAYAAFMGGPGRKLFDLVTWVVDRKIIDGAVNGVGTLVRAGGSQARKVQSGFVRAYALILSVGVVGVLGWFVVRGAIG